MFQRGEVRQNMDNKAICSSIKIASDCLMTNVTEMCLIIVSGV